MTTLTGLQQTAVSQIIACYKNDIREVHFKAPTGSGKTLMAANVIASLLNEYQGSRKFIFIVATISNADLPQSFESKINIYKPDLPFSDFEVEYIQSPSNKDIKDYTSQIKLEENKVYIFGKATFGKGRIYTERNIIEDFIAECKVQNYEVIYIRDEAHIGERATKLDKTFESVMDKNASFIMKMTATFDNKSIAHRVELKESDLRDPIKNDGKFLIKCSPQILNDEILLDEKLIDLAIVKFKVIKAEYKALSGMFINPAMLIQVDNETVANQEQFDGTVKLLKDKIKANGLSFVQYFGGNDRDYSNIDNKDFTLDKITRNNDTTDCIIFKIGPATGWDIPRACMLLQLRNVCSKSLSIQTIGRIKRNPYPNLVRHEITDKYYIFTNVPKNSNQDYAIHEYKLKEEFRRDEFIAIEIIEKGGGDINIEKIEEFLKNQKDKIAAKIPESFKDGQFIDSQTKLVIKSPILLLKHIEIAMQNLNKEQRQYLSHIQSIYDRYFTDTEWETVCIVLLKFFISEITNIIASLRETNISYQFKFSSIQPDIYYTIFDTSKDNTEINKYTNNHLFEMKCTNTHDKIQLDSEAEKFVFDKLMKYHDKIKIWAKNPSTSNIYGEYLDGNNNKHSSYFDFIIKLNNGNYLYIEVKDNQDIKSEKTELLKNAYFNYFKHGNSSLFDKTFICLAQVDNINKSVTIYCYSANNNASVYSSFEELFSTIDNNEKYNFIQKLLY